MMPPTIATIVEGQGEVAAVPALLRRIIAEISPGTWINLPRPYRIGRGSLIKAGGIETAVAAVAEQGGANTGVLVLFDADDDLPCVLGPRLLARAAAARADRPSSVVLAKREFEAWFLAAAPSLRGVRGLAKDLEAPTDPEQPRDCKGWLTARRTDKRSYKPGASPGSDSALSSAPFAVPRHACRAVPADHPDGTQCPARSRRPADRGTQPCRTRSQ